MSVTTRRMLLTSVLLASGFLASLALADEGPGRPAAAPVAWAWSGDATGLHCLKLCELEDLYRRGTVTCQPTGFLPGGVIAFTNMPAPKLAKRLADRYWVGKHIEPDGYFINQWKRRKALDSCLTIGPSYVDGQPALVFEYPWYTPLFGPMRDEYREVAPGLFLGKMYRRRPCVRFLGYNYLQLQTCEKTGARVVSEGVLTLDPAAVSESPRVIEMK